MKGFVLPESRICVDYWEDRNKDYFRFLTHAHKNRIDKIIDIKDFVIYTSEFTAWYLRDVLKLEVRCVEMAVGCTYTLSDDSKETKYSFDVSLIDANHCPGSVMYLFQGSFGTVLCTGDFRYVRTMCSNPVMKSVIDSKSLDILNFDNKFIADHCNFPSQEVAKVSVLETIRKFSDHRVEICVGTLGKVDLLCYLSEQLNKPIYVEEKLMAVVEKLGCSQFFTRDEEATNCFAVEIELADFKTVNLKRKEYGSVKMVVLTPLYSTTPNFTTQQYKEFNKKGVHVIPYSDHSSHGELIEFITILKPKKLEPIFYPVTYKNFPSVFKGISKNVVIPQNLLTALESRNFDTFTQSLDMEWLTDKEDNVDPLIESSNEEYLTPVNVSPVRSENKPVEDPVTDIPDVSEAGNDNVVSMKCHSNNTDSKCEKSPTGLKDQVVNVDNDTMDSMKCFMDSSQAVISSDESENEISLLSPKCKRNHEKVDDDVGEKRFCKSTTNTEKTCDQMMSALDDVAMELTELFPPDRLAGNESSDEDLDQTADSVFLLQNMAEVNMNSDKRTCFCTDKPDDKLNYWINKGVKDVLRHETFLKTLTDL